MGTKLFRGTHQRCLIKVDKFKILKLGNKCMKHSIISRRQVSVKWYSLKKTRWRSQNKISLHRLLSFSGKGSRLNSHRNLISVEKKEERTWHWLLDEYSNKIRLQDSQLEVTYWGTIKLSWEYLSRRTLTKFLTLKKKKPRWKKQTIYDEIGSLRGTQSKDHFKLFYNIRGKTKNKP